MTAKYLNHTDLMVPNPHQERKQGRADFHLQDFQILAHPFEIPWLEASNIIVADVPAQEKKMKKKCRRLKGRTNIMKTRDL